MFAFLLQRVTQSAIVLLIVSILVFAGVYAIGDPIELLVSPESTAEEIEAARVALGLDKSLGEQYWLYLKGLVQGDLGVSFVYNTPTVTLILQRLTATVELGVVAFALSVLMGIPLGLLAGYYSKTPTDHAIMNGSIFMFSLPNFWQGLLFILLFAVWLNWFPAGDRGDVGVIFGIETSLATWDGWRHILLPAFNLALFNAALIIRLTRSSIQEVMSSEYVRYARAKGVSNRRILLRHAFRNIQIPLVTVLGLELGNLLAYGIITETVFDWPGMGQLLINSIKLNDRPVIVGYLLIVVVLFVVINTIVDILYTLLDPRISIDGKKA
ncbi:glutathione transport system permease protein GsiC (plasmid) [Maritalea myrionectae]|uniref:Glutathione transport system permease protein GsiC n=1 Tax=Maritalea myrionectae TaxID=454601 RepID=A0A2R4MJA6_9HYPH|nr:ABC transporter permease [Maritalea myrionectae]AVX06061.1 glutathione transport system permease protein GsiC [Maritalea myrionectae]